MDGPSGDVKAAAAISTATAGAGSTYILTFNSPGFGVLPTTADTVSLRP